jgi:uncharacterized FAD-dependent dehydrogenase
VSKKVTIIGAGPAGLFCAYELKKQDKSVEVLVIDKGKDISDRAEKDLMCGVGGAGCLSDGKLNLSPRIGGNLDKLAHSKSEAQELVELVDSVFLKYGAPDEAYGISSGVIELEKRAMKAGITYVPIKQRHIGSDLLPKVVENFKEELLSTGVRFMPETEVVEIGDRYVLTSDGKKIESDVVLAAVGRAGAKWLADETERLGVRAVHAPIDVGVRVEVPDEVMIDITKISYDPKFHIITSKYDDFVRTFCTNPSGFVVKEEYDGFIGVNGHAYRGKKSTNTNFALLCNVRLTEPLEDTIMYGQSIAEIATTLGGKKPLLQRLKDLREGQRSTWERLNKSYVKPTLRDVTPGDISMAMPGRIISDMLEGLGKLDKVIPGVAEDSTLIYAPEIKYYSMHIRVDKDMRTNLPYLYAAGDGAGLTRGVVTSAASGILAARGMLGNLS